jgi:dihydroflavonol-4-reductase
VFLTGGTGFIGQPLARALLRRGWRVTALARDPASRGARALQAEGAEVVRGDVLGERERLCAAMDGADLVFHNAGWYELGVTRAAAERMRAVNVRGTENVLGLAAELGVPRIVYTSSTTALGDTGGLLADESFTRRAAPRSHYESSKAEAHKLALDFQARGAPLIIACPAQVIGPGDHSPFGHFARLYVRGRLPPSVWAPEAVFTMAHVDDQAEALALAAECGEPGQVYFVAGQPITNREIIAAWKTTPGGFKPFVWLPRPLAALTGALTAPLLRGLGRPAFISREVVASSFVCFRYSSARAERELGARFRPARQAWLDTLAGERAARQRPRG